MANIYSMVDTWNNIATTFTGIGLNVTDTASNAASLLMDLQVGGVSKFYVGKTGRANVLDLNCWDGDLLIYRAGISAARISNGRTSISNELGIGPVNSPSSPDIFLARDAANTLAQRNGTNAQTFNLYKTYTDISNYERGFMKWNGDVFEVGAEGLGSGATTPRAVKYYLDSQYASLTGRNDGYGATLVTRYGTEFNTNSFGVVFLRGIGVALSGNSSNPTRIRPTAKNTVPALPAAGVADLHIEAGFGYSSNPPGSSIKIAAGYGGTPTAEGAGGAGGGVKVWVGEGGAQNTSGGQGADGTFEVLGVNNAGTFGSTPVFAVDYSGNITAPNLPTSDPAVAGRLWNDAGTLKISAG